MSPRSQRPSRTSWPLETGNLVDLDSHGTGWFIGFGEWTRSGHALRFMPNDALAGEIQMKWMDHPAGDPRGNAKPASVGRTISILVSEGGCFHLEFAATADFEPHQVRRHTLQRHGDFAIWGAGLHHRWSVEQACTILTLRWSPTRPAA
jgi:hypothetical protein